MIVRNFLSWKSLSKSSWLGSITKIPIAFNQIFKHNSVHMPPFKFILYKFSFEPNYCILIINSYYTKSKRLQFFDSLFCMLLSCFFHFLLWLAPKMLCTFLRFLLSTQTVLWTFLVVTPQELLMLFCILDYRYYVQHLRIFIFDAKFFLESLSHMCIFASSNTVSAKITNRIFIDFWFWLNFWFCYVPQTFLCDHNHDSYTRSHVMEAYFLFRINKNNSCNSCHQ